MSLVSIGSDEVVEVMKSNGFVYDPAFSSPGSSLPQSPSDDADVSPQLTTDDDDDQLLDSGSTSSPSVEVREAPTRIVIVEPVLALFFASFTSSQVLISQFIYFLVAHRNNLTTSPGTPNMTDIQGCTANTNSSQYELQQFVQSRAALIQTLLSVCMSVPAIIMVLVWGAYSDKIGRKLPMILAMVGQIIKFVILVVTMNMRAYMYLVLVGAAIEGLLGGCPAMMMSCMAYISDISSHVNRTIRLTVIEVICGVCSALGQVIMGFAIQYFGYTIPFYVLMVIHGLNIMYVIFFVPELRYPKTPRRFISAKHVLRTFRLYSREDGSGNRGKRFLCLAALLFCSTTINARFDVLILFGLNTPLCWTSVIIGLYIAWTAVASQAGEMALVSIFCKRIGEMGVAIIGCLSAMVYFVILPFCKTNVAMFLVVLAGCGSFAPVAMIRALKSKLTSPKDQGALFAGTSAVETLCGLLGSLVFNPIYSRTVSFFSGFVFLVMAVIQLIGLIIVCVLAVVTRNIKEPPLITEVMPDDDDEGLINQ